jgi:hypothetical protein
MSQRRILASGRGIVFGGPDQLRYHRSKRGGRQESRRSHGAALLVVAGLRVVYEIVKPDGELDGSRVFGKVGKLVEPAQAVSDVAQVVVGAGRLAIGLRHGGPSLPAIKPGCFTKGEPAVREYGDGLHVPIDKPSPTHPQAPAQTRRPR